MAEYDLDHEAAELSRPNECPSHVAFARRCLQRGLELGQRDRDGLVALMRKLVIGMKWWGQQEDGVPASIWDDYREAAKRVGDTHTGAKNEGQEAQRI